VPAKAGWSSRCDSVHPTCAGDVPADGAETSDRESVRSGSDPPPEQLGAGPAQRPRARRTARRPRSLQRRPRSPTKSPGGKAPEAETRGPRLRTPERGTRNPGQQRPVHRVGPPRQSYSGAGGPQGTAWPRDERPGAAHPTPTARDGLSRARERKHSRRRTGRKRQVGPGTRETRPRPRRQEKSCEGSGEPQERRRVQRNDPSRSREQPTGPVHRRERIRRRMTRKAAFPKRTK